MCVDDESNVLEGLAVTLRADYDVTIALGPEDAFGAIQTFGPPTVVITDMRMQRMDGATFLERLRQMYPDTVRIVLTGHADIEDAARAVNDGRVFRFLTKPCSAAMTRATLAEAVAHANQVASERQAAHQQLRELREALVRADRAARFETLAAGAGHELNNLVAPLTGALEELGHNLRAGRVPDAEALILLDQVARQMQAQARHLLALGRPAGAARARVDLCQLVCETTALARRSRRLPADVRLVFEIPPHPVLASVARGEIEQAIINVLYNAADAVTAAGHPQPTIRIDLVASDDGAIEIEINDDGCGIPEAALSRVFEPYFTTKAPSAGSGLGLTLVKRVLEDHGGRVELTSSEGIGTTVRLRLPAS